MANFTSNTLAIALSFFFLYSCQKENTPQLYVNQQQLKTNQKWIGKKVIFQPSLKAIIKSDSILERDNTDFTIVGYYDGSCTVCYFQLKKWINMIKSLDSTKKVSYRFILSGNNTIYLENNLKVIKFPLQIVEHDEKNDFAKSYPFLLDDYYFNSAMLLDKNDKIVLIGNPTTSEKIKDRYIKLMRK